MFFLFLSKILPRSEAEGGHAAGCSQAGDQCGEDGDDDVKHPLQGFLSGIFHIVSSFKFQFSGFRQKHRKHIVDVLGLRPSVLSSSLCA